MRRYLCVFLALLLLLLTGCGTRTDKKAEVNIYVLSGPTGIGAMHLWEQSEADEKGYRFTMAGSNEEIVAALSNGTADIACVATNLAATLYNKTDGGVTCLAVNTLGVLHLLTLGEPPESLAELKGKTVYLPGQGANPEYILRYVLTGNGLAEDDVTFSFVGESGELLNVWQSEPEAVILAPQPMATSLLTRYAAQGAAEAFDMTEEWDRISDGESTLMMGCVVARTDFCEEAPRTVERFLTAYRASIEAARSDVAGTAALCEKYGLLPQAALAERAIPSCGVTFVGGEEMRTQLGGYLRVMFDADPKSVGGKLPEDDFYYGVF